MTEKKLKQVDKLILGLAGLVLIILIFNQYQLSSLKSGDGLATGVATVGASILPTGTPDIYGKELGIKYDDVSANNPTLADKTIGIMSNFDYMINLNGNDLDRYIKIVGEISCEYCCGAKSIITTEEDVESINLQIEAAIASGQITEAEAQKYRKKAGAAACGCAHSYAMRGLAKYLITEHGDEFSDDGVLTELAKWKTLFFPSQMQAKADVLKQNGIEFSYINLGSNLYRDIEKGSSGGGGMVGGC